MTISRVSLIEIAARKVNETMRAILENVLKNYLSEKQQPMTNNELDRWIRLEAPNLIVESTAIDDERYKVKGSAGKGIWANIPWFAIFDRRITSDAKEGYYIVYLFAKDMSGVYLSLNQGWTFFEDRFNTALGKTKIRTVADYWRKVLMSSLDEFALDEIDLQAGKKGNVRRPQGYQSGHICGKYYSADNLPSDQELINDLRNLLGVYRELVGRMDGRSGDEVNVDILVGLEGSESEITDKMHHESPGAFRNINKLLDSAASNSDSIVSVFLNEDSQIPNIRPRKILLSSNRKPVRIDYERKQRRQARIGLAGELAVLER